MIVISPGVVAVRPFKIHCKELTQEMVDFWVMMGAEAQEIHDAHWSHHRGNVIDKHYRIRMPGVGGKWSHQFNDGSKTFLLHLPERSAPEASLFMLKWPDNIINHTIEIRQNDYCE